MSHRTTLALALALLLASRPGLSQTPDEPSPPLPELSEEPSQDVDASPVQEPTDAAEPREPANVTAKPEPDAPAKPNELPAPKPTDGPVAAAAAAEDEVPRGPADWRVGVGLRMTFVDSPGFDPFATSDALPQATVSLGRVVFREDALSVAGVFTFDVGGRGATARGEATSLRALSFALGPEGRYEVTPWARFHVRPSFVASRLLASIDESSSQTTLYARDWLWGFEAVAGASADLGPLSRGGHVRFSLLAEAGYAWATESSIRFRPDGGDGSAPHRSAPLDLGAVVLRGPTVRIAGALTF